MTTPQLRARRGLSRLLVVAAAAVGLTVPVSSAVASIGDPTVSTTPSAVTSIAATQGKAQGSGLWGYVGDVETRSNDFVFNYGVALSPADGSLWVADSAKYVYSFGGFYLGDSRVLHYELSDTADWSIGQYAGDGTYAAAPAAGTNEGVGANFQTLSQATILNGTTLPNGEFGGARGITVDDDGTAWVLDPDFALSAVTNTKTAVRLLKADNTEGDSFGTGLGWANRNDPLHFDYPVGIARTESETMLITSQYPELLKEYASDGTFIRNINLHQSAGTAYVADSGGRSPYAVATDPTTPENDALVGYIDPGNGNASFIERIDLDTCTTESTSNPAGSSIDRCAVLDTIGLGTLANGNGDNSTSSAVTFTIQVDPLTGDIYVGQRTGLLQVFATDGTHKGSFSAFGGGTQNGQLATVRGVTFDERGFLYATVSEGTNAARVEIFARTPDPITGLTGVYSADRTEATLSWDALALGVTADGQSPLKDYVVESSTDGGTTWTLVPTALSTDASQTVTGLDPEKNYSFRVTAWNEAGNGDPAVTVPVLPVTSQQSNTASLTRTYEWGIDKSILNEDEFSSPVAAGSHDVDFAVALTEDAATDSAATASGHITIDNPNTTAMTADLSNSVTLTGVTCTLAETDDVVIPAEGTTEVSYTCAGTPTGALSGTHTITVAPSDGTSFPAYDDTAALTYTLNEVNKTVTVTDSQHDFDPAWTETWTAQGTVHTKEYSVPVDVVEGETADLENTATITETRQSDTEQIELHGDTVLPPCTLDENAISVVYDTANLTNAPIDGSYVVYDRVGQGRDDMSVTYTIEKDCVTFPYPKIQYEGPWTLDNSDPGTSATFTYEFGAETPELAATWATQIAAMNAMVDQCTSATIDDFAACLEPVIDVWGDSIPAGITGKVTVSVAATTPGAGRLTFWLEQRDTGAHLSPTVISPYVVTQPVVTLAGAGAVCSADLSAYEKDGYRYTPTNAQPTPLSLAASVTEPGASGFGTDFSALYPDDATTIPVDLAGLRYVVDGTAYSTSDSALLALASLDAGTHAATAAYTAPDGIAAKDSSAVSLTVLGAEDARCYTATKIDVPTPDPSDPVVTPKPSNPVTPEPSDPVITPKPSNPVTPEPTTPVTPAPTTAPSAPVTPAPVSSTPPAAQSGDLATTGADPSTVIVGALMALTLLVSGGVLVAVRRRRNGA